jgi:Matrixin
VRTLPRSAALVTALVLAAAPALAASPASAATAPYSLQYLALSNGHRVVARWNPCRTHTYKVNLASVPTATRAAVLAETQASLRVLGAKTGMSFSYRGATSEIPRVGSYARQSADIIIAFTTPLKTNYLYGTADAVGGNAASVMTRTSGTTKTYTAAIVKGFVVVNAPKLLRSYRAGFGTGVRRGNLLLHELGHVVGLNHVSNARLLMNPLLSRYTPNGYAAGDAAGLSVVGRRAGCISGM